jgi:hypothetical protein
MPIREIAEGRRSVMSLKIGLFAIGLLSLCGVACAPAASTGAGTAAYPSGRSFAGVHESIPAMADVDARTEKLGPATPSTAGDAVATQAVRPTSTSPATQGAFVMPNHRNSGR